MNATGTSTRTLGVATLVALACGCSSTVRLADCTFIVPANMARPVVESKSLTVWQSADPLMLGFIAFGSGDGFGKLRVSFDAVSEEIRGGVRIVSGSALLHDRVRADPMMYFEHAGEFVFFDGAAAVAVGAAGKDSCEA